MKLVFKKLLTIIIVLFFVEQVFAESFSASYRVELGPLDLGTLKWKLKIEKIIIQPLCLLRTED